MKWVPTHLLGARRPLHALALAALEPVLGAASAPPGGGQQIIMPRHARRRVPLRGPKVPEISERLELSRRIQLLRRLTRGGGQKYLFQAFMASSHFRRTWWIVVVSYGGLLYIAYSPPIRGAKLPKLIWHSCTARSDLGLYPTF